MLKWFQNKTSTMSTALNETSYRHHWFPMQKREIEQSPLHAIATKRKEIFFSKFFK